MEGQVEMGQTMDKAFKEMKDVLLKNVNAPTPGDGKLLKTNMFWFLFEGKKMAELLNMDWMEELKPMILMMNLVIMVVLLIVVICKIWNNIFW